MLDLLFVGGTLVTGCKDSNIVTNGVIGVLGGKIALIMEAPKYPQDLLQRQYKQLLTHLNFLVNLH